jgi:hypothetical protein
MEVIGNIHDLRESVKLGRAIINMCLEVPVVPVSEVQVKEEPVPKKFIVSVIDCEEYIPFGTFSSEAEAEAAINLDVKNECLNCDCAPGDEDYEWSYNEFRGLFQD